MRGIRVIIPAPNSTSASKKGQSHIARKQQNMQGTEAALRGFTAVDAVLARSYNTNKNNDQKWTEGTIVCKTGPVSYEVQTGSNRR